MQCIALFAFLLWLLSHLKCDCRDTITADKLLNQEETLVSAGNIFQLGFFNSTFDEGEFNIYVGIWYKVSPETIVWVANRDNPIQYDEILVIAIDTDGNLKVVDSKQNYYFSTEITGVSSSKHTAKLLDSGNLVLVDDLSGKRVWQSFDNPSDTFLPGMGMYEGFKLSAWKTTLKDPTTGNYSFQLRNSKYTILQRTVLRWKGSAPGSANPFSFSEVPSTVAYLLSNFSNKYSTSKSNFSSLSYFNYTRLLMNSSGEIQLYRWDMDMGWFLLWSVPQGSCGVYDTCGESGICNTKRLSLCKCLPGFEPASPDDWMAGKFIEGCSRKSVTSCNKKAKYDMFLNVYSMKFEEPDQQYFDAISEDDCRKECLSNCQCLAYSYTEKTEKKRGIPNPESSPHCYIWTNNLKDLQEDYTGGFNLSILVAISDTGAVTRKNCKPCGANIIPYPLSSKPQCGEPLYASFTCDDLTGEVSFKTSNGSYPVIDIDMENRTFVIQVPGRNCDSKEVVTQALWLNQSLPFHQVNNGKPDRLCQVQMIWEPPLEPTCSTSADCQDWPNSSCNITRQGQGRCLCDQFYKWDGIQLNCTQALEAGSRVKAASMNHKALIISLSLTAGIISVCCIGYLMYLGRKVARRKAEEIVRGNRMEYLSEGGHSMTEDDKKRIDVPFFNLESILNATDDFSDANKLGRGGFGPVYKGKFPQGHEMAVKRLSSQSGQGAEEFKNEVMLIAKLQHRNLVRLLGYCIEAKEKILLYEYMPNKSLDTFLFDHDQRQLLDWRIRFDIILDIARGLLYLHHDSRLRIIHRDLKTSNILLDEEMKAKISDFGLARIVQGKSIEANTEKIVGTYGYLSPEYALEGLFSIKSDVFAFGVVVLEIISGKRNLQPIQDTNLLGYAWNLWMEDKALELMDPLVVHTCNEREAFKCIHVAFLCVQENSGDRPTMSDVVLMLATDSMALPTPNQPAFITRRNTANSSSSSSYKPQINDLTITTIEEGR